MRVRGRGSRLAAAAASSIALAIIVLLVGASPAGGAALTNSWQAKIGSAGVNGTATIRAYLDGSGSIALRIAKLRAATSLPVTLSKGTCGSVGATLIRFPTIRTTSAGSAARTSILTAAQLTLIRNATRGTGRITIRVGSSSTGGVKCGPFAVLPVPAYVAARIPIGGGHEGPVLDVNAAGVFVLSWDDRTVSRVDPATNSVATFPLQTSGQEGPDSIAYGEGALWVTMYESNHPGWVERLAPATGAVLVRIQAGSGCSVTTSPGAVWTANARDATIVRIDPATTRVVATVAVQGDPCDPEFAFGSVWVSSDVARAIWRIDPATNEIVATVQTTVANVGLAYALGSVWAIDADGNVLRIDPLTNQVAARIPTGASADSMTTGAMTTGAGAVWVSSPGSDGQPGGALLRIDPLTNQVVQTIPVGSRAGDIAFGGGYAWVAMGGEPFVVQVNAATNTVQARINVGGIPSGIAVTDRTVWVTVPGEDADAGAPPPPATLVRINY